MKKEKKSKSFGWQSFFFAGLALVLFGGVFLIKKIDGKYPFFWMYLGDRMVPAAKVSGPKHVLFLYADHFEPHDQATMDRWMQNYPKFAAKHHDADGKMPQHSWFWYFDKSDDSEKRSFLRQLSQLAFKDYGEIELHLHHWNDTEETFLKKIGDMIQLSKETGAMITAESQPRTTFGFIHGLWSLDNSRGAGACGINNELILLRKLGCYADFTHPSWGVMNPRTVNRLYYATDDPAKPKSYDFGPEVQVGKPALGDLLIFAPQSVVHWNGLKPRYDHGEISAGELPTTNRIDDWVRAGVHVKGRPEWTFIKVFSHGAIKEDDDAVLGEWRSKMHTYMEEIYNDGKNYVLHYVTAREAYNIAKAAEAGRSGDPNNFRDFVIPPYINRFLIASQPFEVISFTGNQVSLRILGSPKEPVTLRFRANNVSVSGEAEVREIKAGRDETTVTLLVRGSGLIGLSGQVTEMLMPRWKR